MSCCVYDEPLLFKGNYGFFSFGFGFHFINMNRKSKHNIIGKYLWTIYYAKTLLWETNLSIYVIQHSIP